MRSPIQIFLVLQDSSQQLSARVPLLDSCTGNGSLAPGFSSTLFHAAPVAIASGTRGRRAAVRASQTL